MSQHDENIRLCDMLTAALTVARISTGRTRSDLDSDDMFRLAIERAIEIIGEAAVHVSPQRRVAMSAIPWRDIIGMRNRLIHGYMAVDRDILWKTVSESIPALIPCLARELTTTPPDAARTPTL